jgi:hypothetical protein
VRLPPLPPPPVTVPTVPVPPVTVPTVPVPPVTVPPVPRSPHVPPTPTVPRVTLPPLDPPTPPAIEGGTSSSGGGAPAASGSPGATGGDAQNTGTSAQGPRAWTGPARVNRLHLTRDWISIGGPKEQRRTTLVFVLQRPALVEFIVVRVSPDCRRIGRFRVRGHRGVNRIPLGRSIGRHSLAPGTYTFVARTLPAGRTLVDARLVVVQRSSRREIRAARDANTCARASDSGSGASSGATGPEVGRPRDPAADKGIQRTRDRGVLGERIARQALAYSPVEGVPVWLLVLSTVAVGLLLTAALHPKAAPRQLIASLALGMTGAAVLLLLVIALL